ncbi:MAG: hypothetical protein HY698_15615 [Deltaproteobacteria bacterium]|nr:hypothetical protein [Deltaproteobacteria bacterium]
MAGDGTIIELKKSVRSILDPVLKFLFDRHRGDFLRLLLGDRTNASVTQVLSPVLAAGELRADALVEVEESGERYVLHVEFQSIAKAGDGMPVRIFHYMAKIHQVYGLPVRSVVLYLLQPSAPLDIPAHLSLEVGGVPRVVVRYEVVKLWDVACDREKLLHHPGLLALAPLMKGVTASDIESLARLATVAPWDARTKAEALGLLALLGGRRFGHDVVSFLVERVAMLREIIQESPLYHMILEEGVAKGRVEGHVEGRVEGRLGALRDACGGLLVAKLGSIPADVGRKLEAISDPDILQNLLVELGTAADVEAVHSALARLR